MASSSTVAVSPITFYWQIATDGKDHLATERCSQPWSLATVNPQSSGETVFPVFLTLYPEGRQPSTQHVLDELGFFTWNANLPVGTNFSIAMTDSESPPNSGGVVDGFYIIDGGLNNCTDAPLRSSPLKVDLSPNDDFCDDVSLVFSGGQPPYKAMVLSAMGGSGNVSGIPNDMASFRNTIPAGQTFNLAFEDSAGHTSVVSESKTSAFNTSSCRKPETKHQANKTSIGVIVGATIAAVVVLILLALLAWWSLRRRSAKASARLRAREEAMKGNYRMEDGTEPLVEPFVIPQDPPAYVSDIKRQPSLTSLDYAASLADPNEFGFRTPTGDIPLTPIDSHPHRI